MKPTKEQLENWHYEWEQGRSKNDIERIELNNPRAHGKLITKLWRQIGIETEEEHRLVIENRKLREEIQRLNTRLSEIARKYER